MRRTTFLPILVLFGCERCAPGRVAKGVGQLTIRNFGAIVSLVSDDSTCGFESNAVKGAFTIDGTAGEAGAVEWKVDRCVLDLAEPKVERDCLDVASAVRGRVTVTATKRVEGYLTGDSAEPVIPSGPGAASIRIESAIVEGFEVKASNSDAFLVNIAGELSGTLRPTLAASAETGVCSIPTKHIAMDDVTYSNALVRVVTKSRDFQVPVPTGAISAIVGRTGGEENRISGHLTVWDASESIEPSELDPDYDAVEHEASFACTEDLAVPIDGSCITDIRPRIAQGASQLTIQMIGKLGQFLDEEPRCGFSTEVPVVTGELGRPGGSATWTVDAPCEVSFPEKTVIDEDCAGVRTFVQGTVRLTGTKTLHGIVSGDPLEPIVPTTREPADVRVTADLSGFALWTDPEEHKLTVVSGRLATRAQPRVAMDLETGACSILTPVSRFTEVVYDDADLVVESRGRRFEVHADTSQLEAQNGSTETLTNHLSGTITLDGETFSIPTGAEAILDPEYEPAAFDASYLCDPNIAVPGSDADCDMTRPLGEGAARLLVMATGAVASLTNANDDCGFEAVGVLLFPDEVIGDPGQTGSMTWSIEGCEVGQSEPYEVDCVENRRFGSGGAFADARRTVRGLREKVIEIGNFGLIDSIVPDSHESVTIELPYVELDGFEAYEIAPSASEPERAITIERGTLSAVVQPITGENASKPGAYDVPTDVARLTEIHLRDADVRIFFEGKTFRVHVSDADLDAFNGSYAGMSMTNLIEGAITIEGKRVELPAAAPLDPDYDQAAFDARYACTEDLSATIPPAP